MFENVSAWTRLNGSRLSWALTSSASSSTLILFNLTATYQDTQAQIFQIRCIRTLQYYLWNLMTDGRGETGAPCPPNWALLLSAARNEVIKASTQALLSQGCAPQCWGAPYKVVAPWEALNNSQGWCWALVKAWVHEKVITSEHAERKWFITHSHLSGDVQTIPQVLRVD